MGRLAGVLGMGDPSAMPDENTSAEDYIAEQYEAAEKLLALRQHPQGQRRAR